MLTKYVTVYTEANPNPNSMKFVLNFTLVPEGATFDFPDAESAAQGSPLAAELFAFNHVRRVFITANFVTVTKDEATEWPDVIPSLRSFVKAYFEAEKPVLTQQRMDAADAALNVNDSEVVRKIKSLLDEYVRPAVESDGGAINFYSFHEGTVKVHLQGSCSGCPSSTLTLKAGIENLLKRMVPEVKEVVAEGV
ncbi:MAG: NifU family protein [Ferruginibacter sp.]|nr:NifU family protein [Cytophagales bacterium]